MTRKKSPSTGRGPLSSTPAPQPLPPDGFGAALAGFADTADCHASEQTLQRIFDTVRRRTGNDFSSYKISTLLRRIERRMSVHDLHSLDRYLALLKEAPQESHLLSQEIMIGVTSFFRDHEAFRLLEREIVPQLFAERGAEPVRIWHPACATGEEVYSLAMLLREYLDAERLDIKVQIFATDIDETAVAHARAGIYPDDVAAEVGEARLKSFFNRLDNRWQVAKPLREMVVFAQHSLIKDPPFSRLDLLVCRNLLIYLTPELQKRLTALFHQVLRPGGFLFLGSAETIGRNEDLFRVVDKKWRLYQRLEGGRRPEMLFPFASSLRRPSGLGLICGAGDPAEPTPASAAERMLAERYAPPYVVVDEKYEVVHVSSRADAFLKVPAGEPTRDLLKMAREELRPALRAAIYKAFAEEEEMAFRGVVLNGGAETVNLLVEPMQCERSGKLVLVVFEAGAPPAPQLATGGEETACGDQQGRERLVRQLEEQLHIMHEQLQATTEQLESSHEGFLSANEELMSINEEFQSANEELQSTNEELETSKEELQALNEELVTLNGELQVKVEELNHANNDMENLLTSSEIATLFLDPELRIKRYTASMAAIFNLIPTDIDRPFRHLAGTIDWSGLLRDAESVLKEHLPIEREVTSMGDGRHYLMRVLPYRTVAGAVDGIVVTLVDLTERKLAEEALLESKQQVERHLAQLQAILDHLSDGVVIADLQGNRFHWNPAALAMHGFSEEESRRDLAELLELTDQEGQVVPCERWPLARILAGETLRDYELRVRRQASDWERVFSFGGRLARDQHGNPLLAVMSVVDVTERKRTEEVHARLAAIVESSDDGIVAKDLQGVIRSWNAGAERMFGYGAQETVGAPIAMLIPPELRWESTEILNKVAAGERVEHFETVRLAKDGRRLAVSVTISPIKDQVGRIIGASKIVRDISARKQAEEALRQSEQRFRTLADAIPQICWVVEPEGGVTWFNQRWYEYTGSSPEQTEPAGWESFHHPEVLPAVKARWQESVDTSTPFEMVFPLRGGDGTYRHFLTRMLPLCDQQGRATRWFGTSTDITVQREAEAALQRSNLRLDLLAQTAGELLASRAAQEVVDSICRKVMEFLDCQAFFNFLVATEGDRLHLNAFAGVPDAELGRLEWLDFGTAVCGCAARDACRIVAEDIPNSGDPRTELVNSYGITAYACHPLLVQGRVLGTLSFGTRTRSSFSEDELALMKAVADQVAIAMERMRMEEELRRAHDELEQRVQARTEELAEAVEAMLIEIGERERAETSLRRLNRLYAVLSETDQAIVRATDRDSLFRDFCRIATEQGGFMLAWVGLLDGDGRVRSVAASGVTSYLDDILVTCDLQPAGEGPTGVAVREGDCAVCNDFLNDPSTLPWQEKGARYGIRSAASIALKEEGKGIGALTLYAGETDFFDPQHVALIRQMGADISFALDVLVREERRRRAEKALQQETLERLRAVEDLREKERLLIQQSRQAALGEMIGNIAHQWRQPLNMLGLMVQELLISYDFEEFSREYLDGSVKNAMQVIRHMSQTIDDFRNFFRPEKEKTPFNVRQAIDSALAIVDASLRRHQIKVSVSVAGDPVIFGYPNEYSQVLLNILLNARDVLLEREVRDPQIEVRLWEEEGRSIVTVEDNAGGIDPDAIEKIFDPYFTTKGPDLGTGVGLYMSKSIIEKNMGGRLAARNLEKGAQFRIEI